jgi:hypothetical protein
MIGTSAFSDRTEFSVTTSFFSAQTRLYSRTIAGATKSCYQQVFVSLTGLTVTIDVPRMMVGRESFYKRIGL